MKHLTCEICSGTSFIKQDGLIVCRGCGTKYTIEEARKLITDDVVEVQGTVKVDTSGELNNLYQIARRAKDDNNAENAAKYYDMILVKDPTSWEAYFYVVYFKAMTCKIAEISSAATSVGNCIDTVLKLINENVTEKEQAYSDVATRVMLIESMLFNSAKNHYDGIGYQIKANYQQEFLNNAFASFRSLYKLGNSLDVLFGDDTIAQQLAVTAWKQGIDFHKSIVSMTADKEGNKLEIESYVSKIKKYDSTYQAPDINTSSGCYVATAIYGSYDCPQVWTLRRYRDYKLAGTCYGRAFIHTYYAISPTLVKWFGHTDWFKKMWRGKLDKMVKRLQAEGYESTPYEDKAW